MTLLRVARNVASLDCAVPFYTALGFRPDGPSRTDTALAELLRVDGVRTLRMRLGGQELELSQCWPQGASYPANAPADAIFFQHIAILTNDIFGMQAAALRAGAVAISEQGPQTLPESSGGVTAWKFRDPDLHPLEFLQLPGERDAAGYDHSAIAVSDAARSTKFYESLGLRQRHQNLNQGPEQNRLDGLPRSIVEVVSLAATRRPHLELLAYRNATPVSIAMRAHDIAADRLVFSSEIEHSSLHRDPDGHFLLMEGK